MSKMRPSRYNPTNLNGGTVPTDPDLAADRAYLNGLRQGYLFGTLGAKQAFRDSEEAYRTQISNHLKQPE